METSFYLISYVFTSLQSILISAGFFSILVGACITALIISFIRH